MVRIGLFQASNPVNNYKIFAQKIFMTYLEKFAKMINKVLKKVGIQILKTATIDNLTNKEKYTADFDASFNRINYLEFRSEDASIRDAIRYAMKSHWRMVDLIEQISGSDKITECALCGHKDMSEYFETIISECRFYGGRLLRHRCPSCGVIFGPQKMLKLDDQMVDLEYRNIYRIYSEGDTTDSVIRTFMLLSPRRDGIYLDFGCGGEWLTSIEKLRKDGWNVVGFEPNVSNSSSYVLSSWEELESKRFDGIISHNVLEHLFDPIGTTKKLANLLNHGGRIVHKTPCFEYRYEYSRFHVFFFTGRSPEVLAERSGLKISKWERDGEFIACILSISK
jgi:hypothetical protein